MIDKTIQNKTKAIAAKAALSFIKDGMKVGLGTGSTAEFFIRELALLCNKGLKIQALATSKASHHLAETLHIPLLDPQNTISLDVVIDGADEVDPQKNMIKGGGGALLFEKIVAAMAKEMIVIVDESKVVTQLGAFPLPLEISPYAYQATFHHLEKAGFSPKIRKTAFGHFLTDSGHMTFDLQLTSPITDPYALDRSLKCIPGVLETGLFLGIATKVIVGHPNETVTLME